MTVRAQRWPTRTRPTPFPSSPLNLCGLTTTGGEMLSKRIIIKRGYLKRLFILLLITASRSSDNVSFLFSQCTRFWSHETSVIFVLKTPRKVIFSHTVHRLGHLEMPHCPIKGNTDPRNFDIYSCSLRLLRYSSRSFKVTHLLRGSLC